ncbi:MAG: glycosyltransferase [Asticcacaulis sp.]
MADNEVMHGPSLLIKALLRLWYFWLRLSDAVDTKLERLNRILILRGRIFDDEWYFEANPDLPKTLKNAADHFVRHGRYEGRKARFFDPAWYLLAHDDVRSTRLDAWTHYQKYGQSEGRVARFYYVHSSLDYQAMPPFQEWVRLYDSRTDKDLEQLVEITENLSLTTSFDVLIHIDENTKTTGQVEALLSALSNQAYKQARFFIGLSDRLSGTLQSQVRNWTAKSSQAELFTLRTADTIYAAYNQLLAKGHSPFVLCLTPGSIPDATALFWFAYQLHQTPDAIVIYSDHDHCNSKKERANPHFKPDFNYDLFLSHNYIGNSYVIRRDALESLNGFDENMGQDAGYDLLWRLHDSFTSEHIAHVPRLLLHYYGTHTPIEASEQAVRNHLARNKLKGDIFKVEEAPEYKRVRLALPEPQPLVSIIIPTRDRLELLKQAIDSVCTLTTWKNYEIIVIDNGSKEHETLTYMANPPYPQVKVIRDARPFNYSALNNLAAKAASGEYLCLMNNDIEIITPDWLEEMMAFACQKDVGCVGARLWYPDGRIQHAGVLVGFHGLAGHMHKFLKSDEHGYADRAILHQSLSAVTAAVLLVRKSIYHEAGGLDEKLAVAFNDVDLCLKVRNMGYRNVYTPYAQMYHHESASRGAEDTPEKKRREQKEISIMKKRYGQSLLNDPAYNSNLTLIAEDLSFAFPPRVQTISELHTISLEALQNT